VLYLLVIIATLALCWVALRLGSSARVRLVRPARPSCRLPGAVADTVGLVLLAAELLGRQVGRLVWRRLGDHQAQRAEMRAVGAELAGRAGASERAAPPATPVETAGVALAGRADQAGANLVDGQGAGVATLTVDEPRPLTGEFSATVDDLRDHNPNRPRASSLLLELYGQRPAVPPNRGRPLMTAHARTGPL
jgi:hypothetical protein